MSNYTIKAKKSYIPDVERFMLEHPGEYIPAVEIVKAIDGRGYIPVIDRIITAIKELQASGRIVVSKDGQSFRVNQ